MQPTDILALAAALAMSSRAMTAGLQFKPTIKLVCGALEQSSSWNAAMADLRGDAPSNTMLARLANEVLPRRAYGVSVGQLRCPRPGSCHELTSFIEDAASAQ